MLEIDHLAPKAEDIVDFEYSAQHPLNARYRPSRLGSRRTVDSDYLDSNIRYRPFLTVERSISTISPQWDEIVDFDYSTPNARYRPPRPGSRRIVDYDYLLLNTQYRSFRLRTRRMVESDYLPLNARYRSSHLRSRRTVESYYRGSNIRNRPFQLPTTGYSISTIAPKFQRIIDFDYPTSNARYPSRQPEDSRIRLSGLEY